MSKLAYIFTTLDPLGQIENSCYRLQKVVVDKVVLDSLGLRRFKAEKDHINETCIAGRI